MHLTLIWITKLYARSGSTDPHGRRNPAKQLPVYGNALIRSFIFVIPFGRTSTKKNSTKPFGNINKGNADSAKPVNRSANITRNIKL